MNALAITGVSAGLGLLFNYLFWGHIPGLSFPIFILAIIGSLAALSAGSGRPLRAPLLWLLAPLGFFSAMVAVRAAPSLLVFNVLATLMLLLLVASLAAGQRLQWLRILDYLRLPFLPLKFLVPLGHALGALFAARPLRRDHPLTGQIIKGVVLAVPALLIFLLLFASADLIFQNYLIQLIDIRFSDTTVVRSIITTIVALAFTGAYAYIFSAAKPAEPAMDRRPRPFGQVESSIILGSVNALFLMFILIQLAYLFGGQANISAQGFTYAEYARKGFFELIAVGVISGLMLWSLDKTVAKTGRGHALAFRMLSSTLVAQVFVVMASAFKRLYLYEQAYGFTALRLYSHAFILLLAAALVILLIKILRNFRETTFAFSMLIAAITFLIGLNLLNPDAFIARQNLDRFHETGKLDGAYLGQLSTDARAEIKEGLSITTGPIHDELDEAVQSHDRPSQHDTDWRSWNYSRRAN